MDDSGALPFRPRMIACDLDGTLLNAAGTHVSSRNAAALARASGAGIKVVVASGRPVTCLAPVIDAGFGGTAICMNGAVIYDIGAREIMSSTPLRAEVMQALVGELSGHIRDFTLAVERFGVMLRDFSAEPNYTHPWELERCLTAERTSLLGAPAGKLMIRGSIASHNLAKKVEECATIAGVDGDLSITYSSDDGLIEIAAAGVNKGYALAGIADAWGIDAADTVAFGDMPNDLEMLRWAGYGVAMANAHPDIVAIADEKTLHHDDDGVAAILERWC